MKKQFHTSVIEKVELLVYFFFLKTCRLTQNLIEPFSKRNKHMNNKRINIAPTYDRAIVCFTGCGEPNNKASDAMEPDKKPTQQKEKDADHILINIA